MCIRSTATIVLLALTSAVQAQQAAPQLVWERWEVAHLGGLRAGYVRTWVVADSDGEERRLTSTVEMRLQVKRLSDTVQLGMDHGTYETPEGVVTGIFMRQYL